MPTSTTTDEDDRLASLYSLAILDTEPEETLDRVARLAAELLDVPIAKINFIDRFRQWTKSSFGEDRSEVPRESSICNLTIEQEEPLILRSIKDEPRLQYSDIPFQFYAGAPLRDRSGENLGALCCLDFKPRDPTSAQISALETLAFLTMELFELRQIATTDFLTGAMSRRSFLDAAKRDVALALRHKRPLSAIMIDLDYFKSINDTYGHSAGDHVLRQVTTIVSQTLRVSDYVGRLGGEEFALILRETPSTNAIEVAERLRTSLSDAVFRFCKLELKVTASFGVAGLGPSIFDAETLLERADASLYAAKSNGRNRTAMLTPDRALDPPDTIPVSPINVDTCDAN